MMQTTTRRLRSSTVASTTVTSKSFEMLRSLLNKLTDDANLHREGEFPECSRLVKSLREIQTHLSNGQVNAHQGDFRHAEGFEQLLNVMRYYSGYYDPSKRSEAEMETLFRLIGAAFGVLSAALRGHNGNKKFFRFRVDGGGWEALEQVIASIGLGGAEPDPWVSCHVFGNLLAFAFDDEGLGLLCQSIAKALRQDKEGPPPTSDEEGNDEWDLILTRSVDSIGPSVRELVNQDTVVRYPEMLRALVGFWTSIPRPADTPPSPASMLVLETILTVISISVYNRAAVHSTGVLSQFLRILFAANSPLAAPEQERVLAICAKLMELGFNQPSDTQFLLTSQSAEASDFCLEMILKYSGPPMFHFDLSLGGHASVELPTLARPFPPQSTAGYTFTAWIRIDEFDPKNHTTIFGLLDPSNICFVLMYIEQDSRKFILQTSVQARNPSVRFNAVTFTPGKWYHIALVHRRPRTMVPSKAYLYVNGQFIESMRAAYPSPPPLSNSRNESFASFNSNQNKTNPVQAFAGIPRRLAGNTGAGRIYSRWSLASAHLFEDVLSEDYLAVHHGLGYRYQGNFQDSLGGFQTYNASAILGLRNELAHQGRDENSEILRAVREKASALLPESKILVSFLPTSTFPEHVQFLDTGLLRSLPRNAYRNLVRISHKENAALAVNSAVPYLPDVLFKTNGLAPFVGDPIVVVPSHLDENLWRLAGFTSLSLRLIERATSVDETVKAIDIMFNSILKNWRNSDAMERDNGYSILGMLLRAKLGYGGLNLTDSPVTRLLISNEDRDSLAFRVLSLILRFVGYSLEEPAKSFIVNPLAYRILLIDLDIWRRAAPRIQEVYYKQFITFSVKSRFQDFNSKRLTRMRIVKRLLDAMKGEGISEEVSPHFMEAFEALVVSNLSQEVMRGLSLFITYAFHVLPASQARTPRPGSSMSGSSTPQQGIIRRGTSENGASTLGPGVKYLSKKQLGARVLEMYSRILCSRGDVNNMKKFARTVTNKWLLYLLSDEDPAIVVQGAKILSRLLVTQGQAYTLKFSDKSGGFAIMASRLKRFWDIPTLWTISFSILFGVDVAEIELEDYFDLPHLLKTFGKRKVVYPDSLEIITCMLQHGLQDVIRHTDEFDATNNDASVTDSPRARPMASLRSVDLIRALETRSTFSNDKDRVLGHISVLQTTIHFLNELHKMSSEFREFALTSDWVRYILAAMYPVLVSADAVTPDVELNSRNSALNFDGNDVIIRPMAGESSPAPIVRTSSVEAMPSPQNTPPKGTPLRRASSFVLLTAHKDTPKSSESPLKQSVLPQQKHTSQDSTKSIVEGLIDLVMGVFFDQVVARKEFPGFGLFQKVPPGFQEHQAYFETYILRHFMTRISSAIRKDPELICEPRVLTNIGRLCFHLSEAIFEGWFLDGAETLIEFNGALLEILQRDDIARRKSVRLCNSAIYSIRNTLLRVILLKLSDLDTQDTTEVETKHFMDKMAFWQMSILECFTAEDDYLKLFFYQLYTKLIEDKPAVRKAAASFLRVILVQKPVESITLIRSCMVSDQKQVSRDFQRITEVDDETFVVWVDEHRPALDLLFYGSMAKTWEDFVSAENQRTTESAKNRLTKRKDKLRQWHIDSISQDKILLNHEIGNSAWMKSIYNTEYFKYQRLMQDQQDDLAYLTSSYRKMERDLRRPGAVFSEPTPLKWKLDRTEGWNRMRLRLLPDNGAIEEGFKPKRKGSENQPVPSLRLNTAVNTPPPNASTAVTPNDGKTLQKPGESDIKSLTDEPVAIDHPASSSVGPEEDFELVDDPNDPIDGDESFEDKNRKVMRRLEHGDQVQAAYNISRITGLEPCEGILIVGKDALYMMDNVFQCASGDIVNVWQAPAEERDPFTLLVTGQKTLEKRQNATGREQESRSWKWQDVISISKRRFLFRDVAIEIFFTDGRSYLLTTINPTMRDDLFMRMLGKVPHISSANALPNPEDAWRLEVLRVVDEAPQGLGARLGGLFNQAPWTPILKKWQKGEVSNFHYLMMVNTLAGRTFNDLTQYPIFPWILADYTSEDLDLEDPATFRDLTKPMGAQTSDRVPGFVETYKSLVEIGDEAFHYGTHYSSAMIVSSFLIRLPPFVHTNLIIQGGSFDHADRLFQSIPDAWDSASRKNKTDVRELIPEFFCLPEFLTNVNGYEFGNRQSSGAKVDHVALPPWAKGDPKIFIAKHREALESPYVSENLHHWIDLVFGHKQRGELAVENLNVFHPLSYNGASDLDSITDPHIRAQKASVIHNFGQTPHQVFTKPHSQREHVQCPVRRLDTSVFSLRCLPTPLLESHERVATLHYAPKLDRLLCASPFRLNLPPYDKFLEWGYSDNSLRFFFSDNRKPAGLLENLHIGQISCAKFADSKTLITAGEDCVVSIYTVQTSFNRPVELNPRSSVFGHKTPVTAMGVSKTFSTFLTASSDGQCFLWDLNTLSFIRKLPLVRAVDCAEINNATGEVLLGSGPNLVLYSLNGALILDQKVCVEPDDYVHSCAFYEGAGNEWLENHLIFTGHSKGRVNIWRKGIKNGKWALEFLRKLDHVDYKSDKGDNTEAGITCVSPMPTCLYTGDEEGRVYEWNFLGRDR